MILTQSTDLNAPTQQSFNWAPILLGWGLFRLPVLLLALYFMRDWIVSSEFFDGEALTPLAIDVLSLPYSRAIVTVVLALFLGLFIWLTLRLRPLLAYLVGFGGTAIFIAVLFEVTGSPLRLAAIPILLAATNFLPRRWLAQAVPDKVVAVAIGFSEILTVRRHVAWLVKLAGFAPSLVQLSRKAGWVLAVLGVSASIAILMSGKSLVPLEQFLRSPETVRTILHNDVNGLAIDQERRSLLVTGHGIDRLMAYNLDDIDGAPRVATVDTGGAQGVTFSSQRDEAYLFNSDTKQVMYLDGDTLDLIREVNADQLASGDPWIAVDERSNRMALVSEADKPDGVAFLLMDLDTGDVIRTGDTDAGNLLVRGDKSWLYMSFFRRTREVQIYDLAAGENIRSAQVPARVDRMALLPQQNELLVTSPATSEIIRLNADTLEELGAIPASFGVRTLAVDSERNLLLAGSFMTGQITVIDLSTFEQLHSAYVGPWIRTIEVDTANGVAFVSSNGALYRWEYGTH